MKHGMLISLVALFSTTCLAYPTGTIVCKNKPSLPNNQYRIEKVTLGESIDLPFVHAVRFFLDEGQIVKSELKGLATQSHLPSSELLLLGQFRLEFADNQLVGCQAP